MAATIRILHLSDFHFREGTHWDAGPLLKELRLAIASLVDAGLKPDLIALTGDIAFSGKEKEYDLARKWIEDSLVPAVPAFDWNNLFIVPGNHDIDRAAVTAGVKAMEDELRKGDQLKIADILCGQDAPNVFRRHAQYLKFANGYRASGNSISDPWWHQTRKFNEFNIGIGGFASSIISFGDDSNDRGRLIISRYQLSEIFGALPAADVRLALIHHPISYFVDEQEAAAQMEAHCSVMLRGHLHTQRTVAHQSSSSGFLEAAAGSVYSDSQYANSFQLIELDLRAAEARIYYRLWQNLKWVADLNAQGVKSDSGCATFPLRVLRSRPTGDRGTEIKTPIGETATRDAGISLTPKGIPIVNKNWSRSVPKLPLPPKALSELGQLLETIRESTFKFLKKRQKALRNRHVRANVFLPDYRHPEDGSAYALYIPDEFRRQMNYPPEWEMRFNTGQGATGLAFQTGRQRISKRLSKGKEGWDSTFQLTDELKKKVHKDLKWIITLPLKDPVTELSLGIMNIDGLDYQFPDEALSEAVASLFLEIKVFALSLAQQPRVNLSFSVEEIVG